MLIKKYFLNELWINTEMTIFAWNIILCWLFFLILVLIATVDFFITLIKSNFFCKKQCVFKNLHHYCMHFSKNFIRFISIRNVYYGFSKINPFAQINNHQENAYVSYKFYLTGTSQSTRMFIRLHTCRNSSLQQLMTNCT